MAGKWVNLIVSQRCITISSSIPRSLQEDDDNLIRHEAFCSLFFTSSDTYGIHFFFMDI